jgi:hypothetical protein
MIVSVIVASVALVGFPISGVLKHAVRSWPSMRAGVCLISQFNWGYNQSIFDHNRRKKQTEFTPYNDATVAVRGAAYQASEIEVDHHTCCCRGHYARRKGDEKNRHVSHEDAP